MSLSAALQRDVPHGAARLVLLCVCVLGCGLAATPGLAQSLWEFDPYRVRMVLAFDDDPTFTPEFTARIEQGVLDRIDAYIGAPWHVESSIAHDPLRWQVLATLDAADPAELADLADGFDKLWVVAVRTTGATTWADFREYDALVQHWGPVLRYDCPRAGRMSEDIFRGLLAVFAPIADIEAVEDKTAELRWRAGALPTRDANVSLLQAGDVLQSFLRATDRDGSTRKVQGIDWTYLALENTEASRGTATVHSGLRSPLARRKRGRVQQLALALRSMPATTTLRVLARTEDARPLSGYEVYAYGPTSPETTFLGLTDSKGEIAIGPEGSRLRLVIVKSGNELLARLPVVPGAESEMEVRLADDAPRLAAEGFLLGLQERLIDVVVRRQVMIARINLRIQQGKLDEAARLVDELRRMDSQPQFLTALDQEQQKVFTGDPAIQRKIEGMFSEARKLVGQFLDPNEVNRAEIELDSARRAQAAAAPREDAQP